MKTSEASKAEKRKEHEALRHKLAPQIARIILADLPIEVLFADDKARLAHGTDVELRVAGSFDVKVRYRKAKASWQFFDSLTFRIWQPYQMANGEYQLKMPPDMPVEPRRYKGVKGADEFTAILTGQNDYYIYCLLNEREDKIVAHYTIDLNVLRLWHQQRLDRASELGRKPPRYPVRRNRNPTDSSFVLIKYSQLPPEAIVGKSGTEQGPQQGLF